MEAKRRPYLPPSKQFLMTRNVTSERRAVEIEGGPAHRNDFTEIVAAENQMDDWLTTNGTSNSASSNGVEGKASTAAEEEIHDIDAAMEAAKPKLAEQSAVEESDNESIPDMEDYDAEQNVIEEPDDPAEYRPSAVSQTGTNENVHRYRTYDLFITYDKYYQTPRFWLYGYNEDRKPLTHEQVFEDISQEHANKTVTIETHPHLNLSLVSIHPCKHANVMKKLMETMDRHSMESKGSQEDGGLRVDQYLMIFLKFIACVVPTIDYDHTVAVQT
eukprot:Partr_v1_DN28379_c1_g1_i6_m79355 putative Autophagy-related protein 3